MLNKQYRIKSIFGPTIQGEGSQCGTPVSFIRFAGCNRWSGVQTKKMESICYFCDTNFVSRDKKSIQQVLDELKNINSPKDVVISGGEPTIQLDEDFVHALSDAGYLLHLETNGSTNIDSIRKYFKHITCSPKQSFKETLISNSDDLKFLHPWISEDINPENFTSFNAKNIFIQPIWDSKYETNLKLTIDYVIKSGHRISLQTHKIIGVE